VNGPPSGEVVPFGYVGAGEGRGCPPPPMMKTRIHRAHMQVAFTIPITGLESIQKGSRPPCLLPRQPWTA
jgi:hypothetical protein